MRAFLPAVLLGLLLFVTGCDEEKAELPPQPQLLTDAATGHYCGMQVLEHSGPKGQIILKSRAEPVWFSSARDAFAFTLLPEEPKDIRAIYVSDMAQAPSWDEPGAANWIDARKAFFVIGSAVKGGMGADETVPFSTKAAAERFAAENGGRVVGFAEVPQAYVLGPGQEGEAAAGAPPAANAHRH